MDKREFWLPDVLLSPPESNQSFYFSDVSCVCRWYSAKLQL